MENMPQILNKEVEAAVKNSVKYQQGPNEQ